MTHGTCGRALQRVVIALCSLVAVGCSRHAAPTPADTSGAGVAAQSAIVTTQPFTAYVRAIGSVVGRTGHVASLGVPAQGRIVRVRVTAGEIVTPGQALVELDPSIFDAALRGARAAVDNARRGSDRTSRLVAAGISPRKDADQAAADLARALADLAMAQRQAQLATVRSPIDGVVTRVNAAVGATADPLQPLIDIADPSALDVVLSTTPSDAARIRRGARVTLSAGQGAGGEALGSATVFAVESTIDTITRSVPVRVRMPAATRRLTIGETVFGQIAIATEAAAVVVPVQALVPDSSGFKVFVVDAQGLAHGRTVTRGAQTDSLVRILGGLSAGERIVTVGAYAVQDSTRIVAPAMAVALAGGKP